MLGNFLGKIGDYVSHWAIQSFLTTHVFWSKGQGLFILCNKNRAMKQHFKPYEFLSDIRHLQNLKGQQLVGRAEWAIIYPSGQFIINPYPELRLVWVWFP